MLGIAQFLAVAAILLPTPTLLREWAYAGLAFDSATAIVSLLATGSSRLQLSFPAIAFVLVVLRCLRNELFPLSEERRKATFPVAILSSQFRPRDVRLWHSRQPDSGSCRLANYQTKSSPKAFSGAHFGKIYFPK